MKIVRAALAVAGGAVTLLLVRSLLEPFLLGEERHVARVPGLPQAWEGRKLVFICDLHVGMVGGPPGTIRRAVRRAVEEEPAAVLIAGDFIHGSEQYIEDAVELLSPLREAGIPVYAVLGNHDYAMPSKKSAGSRQLAAGLERSLESAGVTVMHNEVVELEGPDGTPLYLLGIGAHIARDDDPERALEQLPEGAARLVMMHHPASFNQFPAYSAPFAMAGHTHGGQIRLPLAPVLHYLTYIKELEVIVAGWIDSDGISGYGQEGNHLYVSRGIGCSVLPLRLFCPPELTIFTLTGGRPAVDAGA